jgi:uncharacterized protein (UPF0332 family)
VSREVAAKSLGAASQQKPLTNADGDAAVESAKTLFRSMVEAYVEPEATRRRAGGEWQEDAEIYRFQVQFLDNGEVQTRLNEEVKGILTVKATGPIEAGQAITAADFTEIRDYRLPDEHAHHPHVTAFAHNSEWFLSFQLGGRDPDRHEVLAAGREFLAAARDANEAGRLRVCLDCANSAVELLAKAELLSCAPTIEIAQKLTSHRTLSQAYNVWSGRLGNSDQRYAKALNRLALLRRRARYLENDLECNPAEVTELLAVLHDMERHVSHLAEAPIHELPDRFTVMAARELKAGELVGPDATSIFPTKSC